MNLSRRKFFLACSAAFLLPLPVMGRGATDSANIPEAYRRIGISQYVPPAVLFGVALQESRMLFRTKFGKRSLPWPWTLNVAGAPHRFSTRAHAEIVLREFLAKGFTSIDIGAMQVNWRYHKDRLVTEDHALDPYWNLRVGASILRDHFRDTGNWFLAVGRYHAPADLKRATSYARAVFDHIQSLSNV